jgi:hypothetical protein
MVAMKKKTIKIPIYHGELILIQCKDLKKIEQRYKMNDLKMYDAISFKNHTKSGYSRYVIACTNSSSSKSIVHECIHILNYIFMDRSYRPAMDNDEPQAYLMGWIYSECRKHFKIKW